ncbi:MAG: hypothetical protein V7L27_24470 [Nostoc sp.]|uniref:hypothetical protein n=1 Tax=Nostoc sp. TaxID=1180 RepID=UPI002FFC5981
MKIINLKDAINRRLYKRLIIVETPIHRVSCLNRTVLIPSGKCDPSPIWFSYRNIKEYCICAET